MPFTHRSHVRTVLVAAALLVLGLSAVAGATAAQAEPTVRVADAELAPDGTATADVVLTSAPDGLAGYAVEVRVGSVAEITAASYPDTFGLTSEPTFSDDRTRVTLEAADLNEQIQAGDSDVVLATVELSGLSSGDARLAVEPLQFDTDGGGTMSPATEAGTVTVGGDADAETEASDATESGASSDDGAGDATDDAAASSASDAGDGDETTSTAFALPAGGLVLTALALAFVVAFAARRRR
jgi:hypothetical protein